MKIANHLDAKYWSISQLVQTKWQKTDKLSISKFLENALQNATDRHRAQECRSPWSRQAALRVRCNLIGQLELLGCLDWSFESFHGHGARQEWMQGLLQRCSLSQAFHSITRYQFSLTVSLQDAFLYQGFTAAAHLPFRAQLLQGYPNWAVHSRSTFDCRENLLPVEPCWSV